MNFSTHTTISQEEGTTFHEIFGKAKIEDFKVLATLVVDCQSFDIPLIYYYRITADNFIQFIALVEGCKIKDNEKIESQYKYDTKRSFQENLIRSFEDIFHKRLPFQSLPYKWKSQHLNDTDFETIITSIKDKIKGSSTSPLLEAFKKYQLNPKPYNAEKGLYYANCIGSNKHHIYIDINTDEWGCGYCRKKGGVKELQDWVNVSLM